MKVFHEMPLKLYFILTLRILKSKKKKLALTFFYCLGQDTWLDDLWKFIYLNQSRSYNFFDVKNPKISNITSKYFQQ